MTQADNLIEAIITAKTAEAEAKRRRVAAVMAFAGFVRHRMTKLKISRRILLNRLGWPLSRLQNMLHMGQCLSTAHMAELAEALRPASPAERQQAGCRKRKV